MRESLITFSSPAPLTPSRSAEMITKRDACDGREMASYEGSRSKEDQRGSEREKIEKEDEERIEMERSRTRIGN